jgi:hypothetical protein
VESLCSTYRVPSRVDVEAKVWEARKIARLDLSLDQTDVLEGRVRALQPPLRAGAE